MEFLLSRPRARISVTGVRLSRRDSVGTRQMWIENGLFRRPPPKPDGRFSRIRLSSSWRLMDWLRHSTQGFRKSRTSRTGSRPAHLVLRRSTVGSASNPKPGSPVHPGAQPCGTTRTLVGWNPNGAQHHVPVPLRSTVITRFFATTRTLTPTGPLATGRGSLIYVTRTSEHSISNHLRSSTRRDPLPQRWPLYFVRASPFRSQARQNRRPNRVHLVPHRGPCYGLFVHFQLLSTRGYRPGAVTFSYWPYSVGQVGDSHPAVQVRSQAHERARPGRRSTRRASNASWCVRSNQTVRPSTPYDWRTRHPPEHAGARVIPSSN